MKSVSENVLESKENETKLVSLLIKKMELYDKDGEIKIWQQKTEKYHPFDARCSMFSNNKSKEIDIESTGSGKLGREWDASKTFMETRGKLMGFSEPLRKISKSFKELYYSIEGKSNKTPEEIIEDLIKETNHGINLNDTKNTDVIIKFSPSTHDFVAITDIEYFKSHSKIQDFNKFMNLNRSQNVRRNYIVNVFYVMNFDESEIDKKIRVRTLMAYTKLLDKSRMIFLDCLSIFRVISLFLNTP